VRSASSYWLSSIRARALWSCRRAPRARQIAERLGRVGLVDQNLRGLHLEGGDARFLESETLGRADALVEILQGRKVAVGAQEDLGEIFEALEMALGILREASGRDRFLTLPNQVSSSLIHVSVPDTPRERTDASIRA
jgi:hypothetical protein